MTEDHWITHAYNWVGIRPEVALRIAVMMCLRSREVEATMRQIERRNPKPKANP